ncbi:MAG: hypothetical protein LBD35_02470 [Prevotellaceae bacterium]|jgi:hypothetical protein|nr:hypothetical protein [Prevotellaceae bacterium]
MVNDNYIQILSQIAEMRQKITLLNLLPEFERSFNRVFALFENEGLVCSYPLGERYGETRTDCEASVSGETGENMVITRVLRPIVHERSGSELFLVQRGVVIVENANSQSAEEHENS